MIKMCGTTVFTYVLFWTYFCIECVTAYSNITELLYNDLLVNYNKNIRPESLSTIIETVNFSLSLVSINRFDELNGELDMTSQISMTWTDQRLTWNQTQYGNVSTILFPPDVIWKPQVYVLNAYDLFEIENNQLIRVENNGTCNWTPSHLLKVLCSVYVLYFPVDVQKCKIDFSARSYLEGEMVLSGTAGIDFGYYHINKLWDITGHEISYPDRGDASVLRYDVYIERRATFMMVYIVIPVILVGFLNCFVFLIPASAGERTSVAVTAFLSFVVFMTIINGSVPASSDPVAYLFYYMLFLMSYSCVIMITSILSLQFYEKEGDVPIIIQKFIILVTCGCLCPKRDRSVSPLIHVKPVVDSTDADKNQLPGFDETPEDEITWKTVGLVFDRCCFVITFLTFAIYSAVLFSQVTSNVKADGHI